MCSKRFFFGNPMISSLLLAVALAQSPESPAAVPSLVISCKLPNGIQPESKTLPRDLARHLPYAIHDSENLRVVSDLIYQYDRAFASSKQDAFLISFVIAELMGESSSSKAEKSQYRAELALDQAPRRLVDHVNHLLFDRYPRPRTKFPEGATFAADLEPRLSISAKDGRLLYVTLAANAAASFEPKPFQMPSPSDNSIPEAIWAPIRAFGRPLRTSNTNLGKWVKELVQMGLPVEIEPSLAELPVYIHGKGSITWTEYVLAVMQTYRLEWKPNGSGWILTQTDPTTADLQSLKARCHYANLATLARAGFLTPELFETLSQSASHKWQDLTPETRRSLELLFAKNVTTQENFTNLLSIFSSQNQVELKLHTTLFAGVLVNTPTMTIGTATFVP